MYIDTHTHIYAEQFDEDRDQMINRAISSGVTKMIMPSIDSETTQSMYDLEKKYPNHCFAMMGLHPTHVKENYKQELQFAEKELSKRSFVAIGECGLDYYWDTQFVDQQKEAFKIQLNWAKEKNLPVSIHIRQAEEDFLNIIEEEQDGRLRAVWHCFSGNEEQGKKAIDLGLYLGIGGVVTFKNGKIDTFLKSFSLDNLVLETDAPYLSPVPYRGKRNEPNYIPLVAEKIATIFQKGLDEVADITTQNANKLFF